MEILDECKGRAVVSCGLIVSVIWLAVGAVCDVFFAFNGIISLFYLCQL